LLTLVLALSVAVGTGEAKAYRGWCRADPQFQINGETVLVTIDARVGDLKTARALSTGPISIVLTVPSGSHARYLASNKGFGYGYDVQVVHSHDLKVIDGSMPVRIDLYVPMSDSAIPIRASFLPSGSAEQTVDRYEPSSEGANNGGRKGELSPGSAFGTANEWIVVTT
jgi:hypothetical protein